MTLRQAQGIKMGQFENCTLFCPPLEKSLSRQRREGVRPDNYRDGRGILLMLENLKMDRAEAERLGDLQINANFQINA